MAEESINAILLEQSRESDRLIEKYMNNKEEFLNLNGNSPLYTLDTVLFTVFSVVCAVDYHHIMHNSFAINKNKFVNFSRLTLRELVELSVEG